MKTMESNTVDSGKDRLPLLAVKAPDHENLNLHLSEFLLAMASSVPDRVSNQASGQPYFKNKWLSRTELHKTEDPRLQQFVEFVEQTANRQALQSEAGARLAVMSMWCMVSKPGLVGKRHNHRGRVSTVYYVDTGHSGSQYGGLLQFFMSPGHSQPTHSIDPETGVLYLFPSSLQHSVSRYDGEQPRIVISSNLA